MDLALRFEIVVQMAPVTDSVFEVGQGVSRGWYHSLNRLSAERRISLRDVVSLIVVTWGRNLRRRSLKYQCWLSG